MVETDLYGTFYCCQAVYPVMKAQGGGRIVSISMTLHYRGWPLMAHATAAKAGVDALTRTLALEWAADRHHRQRGRAGPDPDRGSEEGLHPARRRGRDVPAMDEYVARAIPLRRWGKPEDVGQMVTFLASPAGDWITGAIFVVDGGSWLAGRTALRRPRCSWDTTEWHSPSSGSSPSCRSARSSSRCSCADLLWGAFLLRGWEQVRIDPGYTAVTPLQFIHLSDLAQSGRDALAGRSPWRAASTTPGPPETPAGTGRLQRW